MYDLQIFTNSTFGDIRTVTIDGEPWLVGKDVAAALGYKNASKAIMEHVDAEDKRFEMFRVSDSQNGNLVKTAIINESGLYSLVMSSKLPDAKKFRRWVTSEVLPSIRRNGGYIAGQETLTDTELLAKAVLVANRTIEERTARIQELEAKAALDAPKVLFADSVAASKDTILIGELAKILVQNGVPNMGQRRLFQWMRDEGYLTRRAGKDYNIPTQRSMEMGLFQMKETAVTHSDGHVSTSITTRVTGKGQAYFINLFLKTYNLPKPEERRDEQEADDTYQAMLRYFYQVAPSMAICERVHMKKRYLCIPMDAARNVLEEKDTEPRWFFSRIRSDGLTRKRSKGFTFPVRIGQAVNNCLWLVKEP